MVPDAHAADLNYSNKKVKVNVGRTERIYFDAPLVAKGTIVIKSPDVAVNVYIVLEKDVEAALKVIEDGKEPKDVMVSTKATKDKTFEFAPGKKPFALILVSTGKEATVSVTATGK
jgi:hypothetical protein